MAADAASMASSEWEDLALASMDPGLADFFRGSGLGKFAGKIVEATDAASLEDLKLIDAAMVEEVVKEADLKLVSAKKLRLALEKLRGDGPAAAPPAAPSSASSAAAPAAVPAAEAPVPEVVAPKEDCFVQECVAICIDRSGSMGSPFNEVVLNVVEKAKANRTRMEAVKAMFYAFRDRTESVGEGRHEMGLIQFDDRVERLLNLTDRLDRFEAIVDDMEKRGQTAIYSAVVEAVAMLESRTSEERTDLRVLVLTDGQNNTGEPPQAALEAVNRIHAVVDAIIVGDRPDANLRRIVSATGGECYQIKDLGEGFELLEAESVVSLKARRGGGEKPAKVERERVDFSAIQEKALTKAGNVKKAPAVDAALAAQSVARLDALPVDAGEQRGPAIKRIMKELRDVMASTPAGIHIFPAPDNLKFWRALIEGPPDSPFEGGVFALTVLMPDDYPFKPPKISFTTPVYHCNVNDSGSICMDILKDSWSPALTVPKALMSVRQLLLDPNPNDALRQWIAELTLAHEQHGASDTRYPDNAREATRKDASVSVEEWKQRWGCA